MPGILLQILALPLGAALLIWMTRSRNGRHAGWMAIAVLSYTSVLLCLAASRVLRLGPLGEHYLLGPEVSLNLAADGLSLPVALIVNLICLALARLPPLTSA